MHRQGGGAGAAARSQQGQNAAQGFGRRLLADARAGPQPVQGLGQLIGGDRLGQILAAAGPHGLQNQAGSASAETAIRVVRPCKLRCSASAAATASARSRSKSITHTEHLGPLQVLQQQRIAVVAGIVGQLAGEASVLGSDRLPDRLHGLGVDAQGGHAQSRRSFFEFLAHPFALPKVIFLGSIGSQFFGKL